MRQVHKFEIIVVFNCGRLLPRGQIFLDSQPQSMFSLSTKVKNDTNIFITELWKPWVGIFEGMSRLNKEWQDKIRIKVKVKVPAGQGGARVGDTLTRSHHLDFDDVNLPKILNNFLGTPCILTCTFDNP